MKLFLICLALSTSTMAMPTQDNNQTSQSWTDWAQGHREQLMDAFGDGKDQVVEGWEWLQEFLPKTVSTYVEETVDDGQKVFEDLYEETRKSIVDKTSVNVDDLTNLMENFIEKLEKISTSSIDIVYQDEVLSRKQIQDWNKKNKLDVTKDELKQLKEEVAQEKQEDKKLEGIEGMIQRLITSAREMLSEVNNQTDLFWSKVKQMEVEVYKVNSVLAKTSGSLKDVLGDIFETLNKELREASPALKEILDEMEAEESENPRQG